MCKLFELLKKPNLSSAWQMKWLIMAKDKFNTVLLKIIGSLEKLRFIKTTQNR